MFKIEHKNTTLSIGRSSSGPIKENLSTYGIIQISKGNNNLSIGLLRSELDVLIDNLIKLSSKLK